MPRKSTFASRTALFEFFACLCEVVTISGVAARNARRKQKRKAGERVYEKRVEMQSKHVTDWFKPVATPR